MPDRKNNLILILCAIQVSYMNLLLLCQQYTTKRIWTREIFTKQERELHGFFNTAFKVIKERDHDQFYKVTRMNVHLFDLVINLLKEKLTKLSPREPISVECRIVVTLMYIMFCLSTIIFVVIPLILDI